MADNITVVNLSDQAFRLISEDSNFSIPAISYFFRNNLGSINNLLGTDFTINSTTLEFSPTMNDNVKSIYLLMFHIYYVDKKVKNSLGASGVDTVLEVRDFNTSIRKVNKNEVAKTYLQLRKDLQKNLDDLVRDYSKNQFSPVGVYGDDTSEGTFCGTSTNLVFPNTNN